MKKYQKVISYTAIILLAVVARLIPHAPNFAPIGSLALFSGFHKTVPYVYVSFIIIALIGGLIKNNKWQSLFKASLISSVLFFLITNFGVWATGTMYQKNLTGLIQSYTFGIPFFRNTLISDLFYTFSFFYGHRFLSNFVSIKLKLLKRVKTLF